MKNIESKALRRSLTTATALFCMLITYGNHAKADLEINTEPHAYTHIPPTTRQGILETAGTLFKAATGCKRIERAEASVKNIRMMFSEKNLGGKTQILNGKDLQPLPAGGFLLDGQEIPPDSYVQENDEFLQVAGCNTHRDFTVKIFGDDRGVTYFGVFDLEKHPAPEE